MLYRYHVNVLPAATGRKLTQIIRLLLKAPGYIDFRDDMITDFKSTLISRRKLSSGEVKTFHRRAAGHIEDADIAMTNEIHSDVAEDDLLVELLWSRSFILLMQIL